MIEYADISISEDGRWAGDGIIHSGIIWYCPASFGDRDETEAVYGAIETAIARGKSAVQHNGRRYSWTISELEGLS